MSHRIASALFALALTASVTVSAETLQAGKEYPAGTSIEVPGVNVAFTLPAGTMGGLPAGSEFFMIGRGEEVGRVFVWVAQASTERMVQIMSQTIPVAEAVMLTPTSTPTVAGNVVSGDYDATDGMSQYKAHVQTTVGESGVAVAVITVAPAESLASFKALGSKVSASIKFVKPKPTPAAKGGSTGSGALAQSLANMRLIRFSSGSGYSEKEYYDLCGSGRFYHNLDATSTGITGNAGMNEDAQGRWSASGNQVTLTFDNGNSFSVTVTEEGGSLYVDGKKWFRKPNPCQ